MEVKYKIRYKGKMVDASRFDDGSFKVILPNEEKEGEETIHKKIVTYDHKRGWRFESTETKENLTDFEEEQEISELMEIRNQVISQIKFTDDVLALRKERLKTQLELLGYSQFNQINEEGLKLEGFQVLGRLGFELDHFVNLGFVHKDIDEDGTHVVSINEDEVKGNNIGQMIKTIQTELEHDENYMRKKKDLYETFRKPNLEIKPDAFLNMDKKVPEEKWQIYSKIVRNTAELLLSLNYDILPEKLKNSVPDYSRLQGKELQDKISEVIDSKDFANACVIEDEFVIKELDEISSRLGILGDNFVSDYLRESAYKDREDRKRYIGRYKKYYNEPKKESYSEIEYFGE